jgi:hypothetical protein
MAGLRVSFKLQQYGDSLWCCHGLGIFLKVNLQHDALQTLVQHVIYQQLEVDV